MNKKIIGVMFLLVMLPSLAWASSEASLAHLGEKYFKKGQYALALDAYKQALAKNPTSPQLNYNVGSAFFKNRDYPASIAYFQQALSTKEKPLLAKTQYNLGNAFYKHGSSLEQQDLEKAVDALTSSVKAYEGALDIVPKDKDAGHNKEIAQRKLKELQKKLEEQKKQQSSKGGGKRDQKNQAQQSQGQDSKQNQQDQSSQRQNQDAGKENAQDQQGQDKGQAEQKKDQQPKNQPDPSSKEDASESDQTRDLPKNEEDIVLEEYERNEQPKGLLNFVPKSHDEQPVSKDW